MRARQDLTDDKAAERALLLKGEALLLSDAVLVWRGSSQSYFGGTLDEEGVLDFMIWLKQADKLGVKFSADDVGEELKQETLRNLSELPVDKKAEIYQSMQSDFRGLTQTTLAEALGNEFRVRAVQVAMTGTWGGLPPRTDTAPPTWLTPYSFYRDYRDARTTMQVSLLPVQAEKFLDKVSGTPTPNELQEMYDRYKDVEPNPASPTPGFKQPRQVAVQWVNILGETDYFRKKAEEAEKFARAAGQALAGVGVEGGGFIGPASQAAVPVLFDPVELKEYADYVRRAEQRKAAVTDFWGAGFSDTGALAESSFLAPDAPNRKGWPSALAGFTGQLLGQTGTGVPGHLAAVSLPTQAFARELYDRALTGATTVGVVVGGVDHPFAGLGLPMTAVVRPLPFEKVSPLLKRDAIRETLASRKRDADIRELTEELTKRRSKTGPDGRAGLADYVAKWIAERGLQTGTTTQPRSRFTIRLDPGMKPLLSAYEVFARTNDPTLDGFGRPFFDEGPSGVTGLYSVQPFSVGFGEPMYYFWRTEDQAPRVLPLEAKKPGEPQAKEAVETAWRLDKARALAEAEAKKLAEGAAKDAAGDVKKLRDLANAAGAEGAHARSPAADADELPHAADVPAL
jgi:hypothetical protein